MEANHNLWMFNLRLQRCEYNNFVFSPGSDCRTHIYKQKFKKDYVKY